MVAGLTRLGHRKLEPARLAVARLIGQEILVVGVTAALVWMSNPSQFGYGKQIAIVACLTLPLRLRWPWLATLICLAAMTGELALAPTMVALYSIGRTAARPTHTVPWVLAAILASAIPVLISEWHYLSPQASTLSVAFTVVIMVAPAAVGLLLTTRQKLTASVVELRRAREAELFAREDQARAEERARIGQEIHDALGHHATLIAVEAAALMTISDEPETKNSAARMRELAKESLAEMRAAVARSGAAADGGNGLADVPELIRRARDAGLLIGYDDSRAPNAEVAPAVGRAVFRIVQEALTNVVRHAPGAGATVLLSAEGTDLLVVVANGPAAANDGDIAPGTGLGLPGMAERARLVGGSLLVERPDDGGFTMRARLPLNG
jgi:signal transduction histidine kinase